MAIIKGFQAAKVGEVSPYEMPIEDIATGILTREQQSTDNKNSIDETAKALIADVRDHDEDQEKALEFQNNYLNEVEQLVDSYGGDWSQIDKSAMQQIANKHLGSNEYRHLVEAKKNQDEFTKQKQAIEAKGEVAEVFGPYDPTADNLYNEDGSANHFTNQWRVEKKLDPVKRAKEMFNNIGWDLQQAMGYDEKTHGNWLKFFHWKWTEDKDNLQNVKVIIDEALEEFINGTAEGKQYYNILMRDNLKDGLTKEKAHEEAMREIENLITWTGRSVEVTEHKEKETLQTENISPPKGRDGKSNGAGPKEPEKLIPNTQEIDYVTGDGANLSGDGNIMDIMNTMTTKSYDRSSLKSFQDGGFATIDNPYAMDDFMTVTSNTNSAGDERTVGRVKSFAGGVQSWDYDDGTNHSSLSLYTIKGTPPEDPERFNEVIFQDTRPSTWAKFKDANLYNVDEIIEQSGDMLITDEDYAAAVKNSTEGMNRSESEMYKLLKTPGGGLQNPSISTFRTNERSTINGQHIDFEINPSLYALENYYEAKARQSPPDSGKQLIYQAKLEFVRQKIINADLFKNKHADKIEAYKDARSQKLAEAKMYEEAVRDIFDKNKIDYDTYVNNEGKNGQTKERTQYRQVKKESFKDALFNDDSTRRMLPMTETLLNNLLKEGKALYGDDFEDNYWKTAEQLMTKGVTVGDLNSSPIFSNVTKLTRKNVFKYLRWKMHPNRHNKIESGTYPGKFSYPMIPLPKYKGVINHTPAGLINNLVNGVFDQVQPNIDDYTINNDGEWELTNEAKNEEDITHLVTPKEITKDFEVRYNTLVDEEYAVNLKGTENWKNLYKDLEGLTDPINRSGFIIMPRTDSETGGKGRTALETKAYAFIGDHTKEWRRVTWTTEDGNPMREVFNEDDLWSEGGMLHKEYERLGGVAKLGGFKTWYTKYLTENSSFVGIRRDETNMAAFGKNKSHIEGDTPHVAQFNVDFGEGNVISLETDITLSMDELTKIYGTSAYQIKLTEQMRNGLKNTKGFSFQLKGYGDNRGIKVHQALWDSQDVNGQKIKRGQYYILSDGANDKHAGDPNYTLSKKLDKISFNNDYEVFEYFRRRNAQEYATIEELNRQIALIENGEHPANVISGYTEKYGSKDVSPQDIISSLRRGIKKITNELDTGDENSAGFVSNANFNSYVGDGNTTTRPVARITNKKGEDRFYIPKPTWKRLTNKDKADIAFSINSDLKSLDWYTQEDGQQYNVDPETLHTVDHTFEPSINQNFNIIADDMRLGNEMAGFMKSLNTLMDYRRAEIEGETGTHAFAEVTQTLKKFGLESRDIKELNPDKMITITSGLRSLQSNLRAYNAHGTGDIKGLINSNHMRGKSIDIRTSPAYDEFGQPIASATRHNEGGEQLWKFFKTRAGQKLLKFHGISAYYHTVAGKSGMHIDLSVGSSSRPPGKVYEKDWNGNRVDYTYKDL